MKNYLSQLHGYTSRSRGRIINGPINFIVFILSLAHAIIIIIIVVIKVNNRISLSLMSTQYSSMYMNTYGRYL